MKEGDFVGAIEEKLDEKKYTSMQLRRAFMDGSEWMLEYMKRNKLTAGDLLI